MEASKRPRLTQYAVVACWIVAALAAAYVLLKHGAHVFEWLPYVALLACPLMHLFMHRGHGGHDKHGPPPQP